MRVVVTGAGGFIGQKLVPMLRSDPEFDVVVFSRSVGKNILDLNDLLEIGKFDAIIHLAANTFVPNSFSEPYNFYYFNQNATLNVCEAARRYHAKVIYLSSYFYGPPQYIPVDEKHPLHPHNPYAQTKLLSELIVEGYSRDFKIPACSLRLFNIYGPGQDSSFLLPAIVSQIETGRVILKDPRPKRDFVHLDDVTRSIINAVKLIKNDYHVINIGSGFSHSVEEVVSILQELSPKPFKVEYTNEYRDGEVLDSVADVSLAKDVLNWSPSVDIKTGLSTLF